VIGGTNHKNCDYMIDDYTYNTDKIISGLFCPSIDEAVAEIENRRKNPDLAKKVADYLQNDIPEHFSRSKPIFYFSRHLATPNFETEQVIEITKLHNLALVIGEDIKGIFVANNELKISLAKLPVVSGFSRRGDEIIENVTIVDFSTNQGKPMDEILTKSGETLSNFHHNLFKSVYPNLPEIVDESQWIDRNNRNDIREQYKKMLALLCVHGIMFESYVPNESKFVSEVVKPAFDAIEKEIGVRPLIVEHISSDLELTRNWNSYPNNVYDFVQERTNFK
jgi:hypothetical protein